MDMQHTARRGRLFHHTGGRMFTSRTARVAPPLRRCGRARPPNSAQARCGGSPGRLGKSGEKAGNTPHGSRTGTDAELVHPIARRGTAHWFPVPARVSVHMSRRFYSRRCSPRAWLTGREQHGRRERRQQTAGTFHMDTSFAGRERSSAPARSVFLSADRRPVRTRGRGR